MVGIQCSLQLLYFMTDKSTKCGVDICTYYPEVNQSPDQEAFTEIQDNVKMALTS